jgi:hypothetical protein
MNHNLCAEIERASNVFLHQLAFDPDTMTIVPLSKDIRKFEELHDLLGLNILMELPSAPLQTTKNGKISLLNGHWVDITTVKPLVKWI